MTVPVGTPDDTLLDGARRAVTKHGWHGATLERIAREAGLSRVTLHRRGISKASILRGLADAYEADYRAALVPATTATGPADDCLRTALEAICDVTDRHLATLTALSDEEDSALFHVQRDEPVSREYLVEPVRQLVERGTAEGTIAAPDPAETATVLVNVVERTYRHLRHVHGWSPERSRSTLVAMVMQGIAARS